MASDIGSIQPNPYLFNIENRRKRKARLAHEIGAGARCRKCEDKCPGFQLHFWRKLCQNCRCGKDDHEVEDDDEDIGKIVIGKLFERPIRTKEEEQEYSYGTDLEMVNDTTGVKEKLKFDWVPPGVERAIAKRYMEMLPPEKRPVAGSEAAKQRRRQLEQQIPLYDMDESERCETLDPAEMQNFLKYLTVLRTRVAGQASVQEIVPQLPKQPPPSVLTFTSPDELPPPPDSWFTDGTPAEGVPGVRDFYRDIENSLNNNLGVESQPIGTNMGRSVARQLIEDPHSLSQPMEGLTVSNKVALVRATTETPHYPSEVRSQPYTPVKSELAYPGPHPGDSMRSLSPLGKHGGVSQAPSSPSRNLNSTASKSAVVQLTSPKPFMAHCEKQTIQPEQFSTRLTDRPGKHTIPAGGLLQRGISPHSEAREGQPPCAVMREVNENLPMHRGHLPQMVPKEGGVRNVDAMQAPYVAHKDILHGPGGRSALGSDVTILLPQESETIQGQRLHPTIAESSLAQFGCQYCKQSMKSGDVAVICERAGPGKYWHPKCFVCVTCKELLADLIYFYKDGQVFCGRHYTQAADIPRCKACDELIFGDSWTRADGCDWHIHHYCCFICDKPLAGSKYIPDEKDFPHCLSCFMSFKAKMCETCEDKITPEQTRAGYNGYFYHALPQCFCCYHCKSSLMGKKFKMVKNWVFCSQNCVNASEADIAMNFNPKKKEL